MHKPFRAAVLILAASLLGCPKRIDYGSRGPITDPNEVLAALDQQGGQARSLDGEGSLSFDFPEGSASVGAFVLAEAPANLQIQANDFFGRPVSVLVSDGKWFGLWSSADHAYFTGPATAHNLARFMRVALEPSEVVALLLGQAPRVTAPSWTMQIDPQKLAYRLAGTDGTRYQVLWVDPATLRPVETQVTARDGRGYRASFESRGVALQSLPEGKTSTQLKLRLKNVQLNGAVDPSQFQPEPPEGVRVIQLDPHGAVVNP